MPRRRKVDFVREIGVDSRYGSALIQRLINTVTRRGKKSIACSIVYGALEFIEKKQNGDREKTIEFFDKAIEEVTPLIAVRSKRVGGSVYQIPMEVPKRRGQSLALRWIIEAAKERSDKTMSQRLATELMEANESRGGAVKKKLDVQRMAEANRAFSHYAW